MRKVIFIIEQCVECPHNIDKNRKPFCYIVSCELQMKWTKPRPVGEAMFPDFCPLPEA